MGNPHGAATEDVRTRLRIDNAALACLSEQERVFSPMPVIDEVTEVVRAHNSMAFLEQSAMAIHVRMAVLGSL
jgi:aspartate carbamoyltransferase catalytic subunit